MIACHCLCGHAHPGRPGVCDAWRPVTSRTYQTVAFGDVDVPLCVPCALAQGVAVPLGTVELDRPLAPVQDVA